MLDLHPTQAKRKWQHSPGDVAPRADRDPERERSGGDRSLVCVRCGRTIAAVEDAIEVGGLHEYTQVNPGGFIWNFRCFARAPGCAAVGAPSTEFAWFAGYTWRIAHCAECDLHLGWQFLACDQVLQGGSLRSQDDRSAPPAPGKFSSADDGFYGLIVERVVEAG